jgi:predicted nuclease with TOPRIM domain
MYDEMIELIKEFEELQNKYLEVREELKQI